MKTVWTEYTNKNKILKIVGQPIRADFASA